MRTTISRLLAPIVAFLFVNQLAGAAIEPGESETSPSETRVEVKVAVLREGTIPITIHALGQVSAPRQVPASLVALGPGVVTKIPVRDGEQVASGTLLIQMDPRAAQAGLRKAQSDVRLAEKEWQYSRKSGAAQQQTDLDMAASEARIRAAQAAKESDRLSRLFAKQLVSEKAATEARELAQTTRRQADAAAKKAADYRRDGKDLDMERLQARLEEARAALHMAELDAEATTVRAPMAGRVMRLHVAARQAVDKGTVLIELVSRQGVGASFALPPDQAGRIRPGMAFALADARATRQFHGAILSVDAGVDSDTGLVRIEGVIQSNGPTAPFLGEVLRGEITVGESEKGFVVPLSALSVGDEETVVHIVGDKNQAVETKVEVLARDSRQAVIRAKDLKPGQRVITDGNYNMPDGAVVVAEKQS